MSEKAEIAKKVENVQQEQTPLRRVRNTFNYKTGLPVMVNLLIIRTIYYGMRDKADMFVEVHTEHKKKKYVPVYSNTILNISRSRYDRIQRGAPFEISNREAKELSELFNIDIKYFKRNKPDMFPTKGIDKEDWKCYYYNVRDIQYEFEDDVEDTDIEKNAEKVKETLKEIARKDWSEEKDSNPMFRIWYYFKNGKRYEKTNPVDKCMTELMKLDMQEWNSWFGKKGLENYRDILQAHYQYVNALVTINKLKN